jgi:hypothetical protein
MQVISTEVYAVVVFAGSRDDAGHPLLLQIDFRDAALEPAHA